MMKRRSISALILLVVILLNATFCASAVAEGYKVYVSDSTVKIYEKWDTSSKCIYAMSYGEAMTCTGFKSGWAQLKAPNGAIGYCKTDGLSVNNPCTLSTEVYATSSQTPVYKSLVSKSAGVAYVDAGTTMTVVGSTSNGNWLRVRKGRYYGYVAKANMQVPQIAYLDTDRTSASIYNAGGSSVAVVNFGEKLLVTGVSNGIAAVRTTGGKKGYITKSYLTTSNPNTLKATGYVQAEGAYVYKAASTSSGTLAHLTKDDTITVIASSRSGDWYRVKQGNTTGYMRSETISPSAAGSTVTLYPSVDGLEMKSELSASSATVATLKRDEAVTVVAYYKEGIAVVTQEGITGYCPYGTLIKQ